MSYNIATQTPQYRVDSLQDLQNIPITNGTAPPQILASLSSFTRGSEMAVVSHYDIQPVIDIFGSVDGRDLGGVARDIAKIIDQSKKDLPQGSQIIERGQIQTMRSSFIGLLAGLAFSILLVYLLIVVNFQSWLDPFIILMALPAALAGIVWLLFVTGTTISVPALTGAIMCMGVATANSILVISFSKERLEEGEDPGEAALERGIHAVPAGADDGAGDDYRNAAHVAGPRRRWRAERAAGPRRDRRTVVRNRSDAILRSGVFQLCAQLAAE